jgi:hypothetical protein
LLASQYVADNFSGEKRLDRLGRQGLPVADYVVEVRHHPRFHVRAAVARLMGRFGTPHHMQYLIPMLNDPDLIVRQKASIGLKRLARAYYGIDAHAHDLREAEIDHLGSNDAALSGAEVEALRRRDETLKIMLQFNPRTEDIAVRQRTQEAWRTFLQSAR